jgi:hypothetical protein
LDRSEAQSQQVAAESEMRAFGIAGLCLRAVHAESRRLLASDRAKMKY